MNYSNSFKEHVLAACQESVNDYVGSGNPNSQILIVGKEAAINQEGDDFEKKNFLNYKNNAEDWKLNIEKHIGFEDIKDWNIQEYMEDPNASNNPLFPFKSVRMSEHREGQTWRKYQKLHDLIYMGEINSNKNRIYNFPEDFFITEMNDSPAKTTQEAIKDSIEERKIKFKNSRFIQDFPVIILACSNYIWNIGEGEDRQIDNVFDVGFEHYECDVKQNFYLHYNKDRSKLVIHTRQLSMNVSDDLLKEMAKIIRNHLNLCHSN